MAPKLITCGYQFINSFQFTEVERLPTIDPESRLRATQPVFKEING